MAQPSVDRTSWNGELPEDTQGFIDALRQQLDFGYGFVPFIGAGFSAPSGAPLTTELKDYLQRCICVSFGIDLPPQSDPDDGASIIPDSIEPWNPKTDRWPPLIDRVRVRQSGWWSNRAFAEISAANKRSDLDHETRRWLRLLVEGYGAMQDWRTALLYLSRLIRDPRGADEPHQPTLGAPSQEVVDACFREVLKGRHPTLGHRMLAALGGALRLDLVLTTNFDDLLEQAFEAARNPLSVFEVPLGGALPVYSAVSGGRTIIKLHGGRSAIRADYSLDQPPSEEDKQRFLEYFLSSEGRLAVRRGAPGPFKFQNHLLVLGMSGSDRRIRGLIQHARATLVPDFRVFWVCFSESDRQEVSAAFDDRATRHHERTPVVTLRHSQSGLLLFQLYQTLRKSLPPLGTVFPSVSRQTLPPLEPHKVHEALKPLHQRLDDIVTHIARPAGEGEPRLRLVYSTPGTVSGVTSACARAFRRLETESHTNCMWIDMNDISSADNLYEELLESTYYRLGLEDWIPSTSGYHVLPDDLMKARTHEVDRLVGSTNRDWVLFLNARETPGVNTLRDVAGSNGWIDRPVSGNIDDPSSCLTAFVSLMKVLCEAKSPLSVVLMCRDTTRLVEGLVRQEVAHELIPLTEAQGSDFFDESEVVREAILWTEGEPAKTRFLHGLVLIQRPRLFATIWHSALWSPGPGDSDGTPIEWIEALENTFLLRRKPGGLIWLHSKCRQLLRRVLRDYPTGVPSGPDAERIAAIGADPPVRATLMKWRPAQQAAGIHRGIASWYEKVLDASDAPAAAFESAYHYCEAARSFASTADFTECVASIDAAEALLKANSFLIQTHGYSRGSCRKLDLIADVGTDVFHSVEKLSAPDDDTGPEDVRDSVKRLWITCVELMRAVAREVGEDQKAFLRHRQVGRINAGMTWSTVKYTEETYSISRSLASHLPGTRDRRSGERPRQGPSVELIRWLRWTGTLALGSRSYPLAQHFLEKIIGTFGPLTDENRVPLENEAQRVEVLRAIEQAVQLELLRWHLVHRLRGLQIPRARHEATMLRAVDRLIKRGLDLSQKIRRSDRSSDAHYAVRANWCETRLLMHRSIVKISQPGQANRFVTALAVLGDAEAKLRVSDPKRSRSELAMLDLHRAEVRMREAEECLAGSVDARNASEIERRNRRASALIADTLRFLDRAEPVLRDRRRNVWWTTWFFERKLRAIALSIRTAADETPIPFLGLEAAMRLTDTEADRLLNDALRMIRVDSYRLASVVDAYCACLVALERKTAGLPIRQARMRSELHKALVTLDKVHHTRIQGYQGSGYEKAAALDDDVKTYVEAVRQRVTRFLSTGNQPG